jgi:hypothetical protein
LNNQGLSLLIYGSLLSLPISLFLGLLVAMNPPRNILKLILVGAIAVIGGSTLLFIAVFVYSTVTRPEGGTCDGGVHWAIAAPPHSEAYAA